MICNLLSSLKPIKFQRCFKESTLISPVLGHSTGQVGHVGHVGQVRLGQFGQVGQAGTYTGGQRGEG